MYNLQWKVRSSRARKSKSELNRDLPAYRTEGPETLDSLNEVLTDQDGRHFEDMKIRHIIILGTFSFSSFFLYSRMKLTQSLLDDPFPDPPNFIQPPSFSCARPPENSPHRRRDPLAILPEEEIRWRPGYARGCLPLAGVPIQFQPYV
jgi:hypothetical protein